MNIIYKENFLTAEIYIDFQKKMKWKPDKYEQAEKSLKNDLYDVAAIHEGELVGMGRLVGDGAIYWYIQDVFILTEYQGKEGFYEKLGLKCRPNKQDDAGMNMDLVTD